MIVVKIGKKTINDGAIKKYLAPKILGYLKSLFADDIVNIIDDSKSLEFVSSDYSDQNENSSTIELTFKKTITINKESMVDRQYVDKVISEVKNFCDQAVIINNYVYLPLNMREQKDANIRTSTTGRN